MSEPSKACGRCGAVKPDTTEYFPPGSSRKPSAICRACRWPEKPQVVDGQLRCTHCQELLPATAEYFPLRIFRTGALGFQSWCRRCARAASLKSDRQNPAGQQARQEKYRATPAGKEKLRERQRLERLNFPERVRQRRRQWYLDHPERTVELRRAGYCRLKDVVMGRNRNRRALKKGSVGQHTAADVRAQMESQEGRCFYCRHPLDFGRPRAVHVDHFIPLTRGGGNGPDNIVVACQTCNSSKVDKLPWDWMPGRFSPPTE